MRSTFFGIIFLILTELISLGSSVSPNFRYGTGLRKSLKTLFVDVSKVSTVGNVTEGGVFEYPFTSITREEPSNVKCASPVFGALTRFSKSSRNALILFSNDKNEGMA